MSGEASTGHETYPRRIVRRVLMFLVALITIVFWLPFARSLVEGDSYEWGLFGVGGSGIGVELLLPSAGVALALVTRWCGQRGSRRSAGASMIGFFGLLFVAALVAAFTIPESMVVRGDTLGMRFSFAWVGPVLFAAATLGALWWAAGAKDVSPARGWSRMGLVWLAIAGALVVASVFLLLEGDQHGVTDGYGVRALGWSWLLLDGWLIGSASHGSIARPRDPERSLAAIS